MKKTTINHDEIKRWTEQRNGMPAKLKGGADLKINFLGYEADIENISWDEFFDIFEKNHLAMIFEEENAKGNISRYSKFANREQVQA